MRIRSITAFARFIAHQHTEVGQLQTGGVSASPLRSSSSGSSVTLIDEDGYSVVELNNPQSRNALTPQMMIDLARIVQQLHLRPSSQLQPLLILKGAGGHFCAGADIRAATANLMSKRAGRLMATMMCDVSSAIAQLPCVSVAAVDGAAVGGGAELCCACDLRSMSPASTIRFIQAERGVTPGWGGAAALRNIVGPSRALSLLLTRRSVTPNEALTIGLADVLSAEGESASAAALRVLRNLDPSVVLATKRVVRTADRERECREFQGLWGSGAHAAAFAVALKK